MTIGTASTTTWPVDEDFTEGFADVAAAAGCALTPDGVLTWRETKIDTSLVTDLEVSYELLDGLKLTAGANNLLNKYPNRINGLLRQHQLQQNSNGYVTQYPSGSPFGINGGYYYGKLTWTF